VLVKDDDCNSQGYTSVLIGKLGSKNFSAAKREAVVQMLFNNNDGDEGDDANPSLLSLSKIG
jgi:hypothetical protein